MADGLPGSRNRLFPRTVCSFRGQQNIGNGQVRVPRLQEVSWAFAAVLTSLGLVWKRDVPNVRRERVERRRELARLWEGGSTGVDIFDLRYLFGKEIDPDCW
ncbi:uncharacterized protein LOC114881224 isoform X1 [Osmia bicornis bicornis]|uniref:uncharacterized protein LOC114881224 isoform X1 n=1 Tax=Osmia bicornis bicornis TaxID=1437191 RepID=UPI0010F75669|nr:uncharacterized protein LOC114881224 isoform X1 [Osmia bicornis bicornis]